MKIEILQSLQGIPSAVESLFRSSDFPFTDLRFLRALEETNCLGTRTGWHPLHLVMWEDNLPVGLLLNFVKTNSYGEYIFDFAWAEFFHSVGQNYYPKFVSALPFTPATGGKILWRSDLTESQKAAGAKTLLAEWKNLASRSAVGSAHALFVPKGELELYEDSGFFLRHSYQYHWQNRGYGCFDDFLAELKSKRRRDIRQERAKVQEQGIGIRKLTGADLNSDHAQLFYRFYQDTIDKRQGFDYLTLEFFERVFREMKNQILLVLAEDQRGQPLAGALNYFNSRALYGRHWGCLADFKFLHFELCYYQGIDFAIERKLALFEAGAQGEHKFNRGFLPALTYSAHWIAEEKLRSSLRQFSRVEEKQIKELFAHYQAHPPFAQA